MNILRPLTDHLLPKHYALWLLAGVCFLCALAWFVNTYIPDTPFTIAIFFILFTSCTLSLSRIIFKHPRHTWLLALGLSLLLFLRMIGLRDALYGWLLVATLLSIELYLKKR